jgi:magnesium-transporting ATPase (P-type)
MVTTTSPRVGSSPAAVDLITAATRSAHEVLIDLGSGEDGLTPVEARRRLDVIGPNALRSHGGRPLAVLVRQLRNPLLLLLAGAAFTSFFVGERTDAAIIFLIIGLSVGLGFFNEYRSERAVEALHSQLRHTALAVRDGEVTPVDVTALVPGDVVRLSVGDVVAADLRLLEADGLECDEAVLTGESLPAEKQVEPVADPDSPLALPPCAFMGTVVREGSVDDLGGRPNGDLDPLLAQGVGDRIGDLMGRTMPRRVCDQDGSGHRGSPTGSAIVDASCAVVPPWTPRGSTRIGQATLRTSRFETLPRRSRRIGP